MTATVALQGVTAVSLTPDAVDPGFGTEAEGTYIGGPNEVASDGTEPAYPADREPTPEEARRDAELGALSEDEARALHAANAAVTAPETSDDEPAAEAGEPEPEAEAEAGAEKATPWWKQKP